MPQVFTICILKVTILCGLLILFGCQSAPEKDFSFVEKAIFPLPETNWSEVQSEHVRKIEFDCSFEDYASWLVQVEGYQQSVGLENDGDADRHKIEILGYLSSKDPDRRDQGGYVGVQWLAEDAVPPFAITITSHVYRASVVSVKIESSHL